MKNFVHKGETLTVIAPYNVASGTGLQVGTMFGIAVGTQITGDNMEMDVVGVFDVAKDTSTFASGDPVFWDNVNKVATSIVGGNLHIGAAELTNPDASSAAGGLTGDATVRVRLNGAFSPKTFALRFARAILNFAVDGGAVGAIIPAVSDTIPAGAIIVGSVINSTTAVTSGGAATIAVGTTAGSSASAILAATAKATFSLDAVIGGAAQFATPVKMSAAGQISLTVAVAALTAGVIEIDVAYIEAAAL